MGLPVLPGLRVLPGLPGHKDQPARASAFRAKLVPLVPPGLLGLPVKLVPLVLRAQIRQFPVPLVPLVLPGLRAKPA